MAVDGWSEEIDGKLKSPDRAAKWNRFRGSGFVSSEKRHSRFLPHHSGFGRGVGR